jgi:hypothetical protein
MIRRIFLFLLFYFFLSYTIEKTLSNFTQKNIIKILLSIFMKMNELRKNPVILEFYFIFASWNNSFQTAIQKLKHASNWMGSCMVFLMLQLILPMNFFSEGFSFVFIFGAVMLRFLDTKFKLKICNGYEVHFLVFIFAFLWFEGHSMDWKVFT